ncbi:hypothetical protein BJX76DRAFT_366539 [Aspergillus varians]
MADSKRLNPRGGRGGGRRPEGHGQRPQLEQTQSSKMESQGENDTSVGIDNTFTNTVTGLPSNRVNHHRGSRGGRRGTAPRVRLGLTANHPPRAARPAPQSSLPFRNGPTKPETTKLSPGQVKDILETTLSEISCSDSSGVTVVNNWATEAGLASVREIVETDFAESYSVTRLMFDPHCVLFLRLISYISCEDIQTSLFLERSVGTIYNVIYGPNGNRGVTFFRRVVSCLAHLQNEGRDVTSDNENQYEKVLLHVTEAILSTLLQIQEAVFKSEFKEIAGTLWSLFFVNDADHRPKSHVGRLARENLSKVQDIFHTGDITASVQKVRGGEIEAIQCQPTAMVDFPGELSQSGIRHDNDHAAISDIKILPTLSEIWYSRRLDFLPTKDALFSLDQHHEKGIRRLLDYHFRLLREDTSGILRDSVRVILEHWETLVHGTRWQDKRKILRTHSPTPVRIYYGAQIRKVNSDRIKGMEIDVEFDQLPRARNMSVWKRKHHWRDIRGLNEGGALLALIDGEAKEDISVIFLQVSKRNIDPVTDDNHKDIVCDLVSSGQRAMITLRLTSPPSNGDLDGIIHLANNQFSSSARSLILVEFPALLYNAFEGILRCLQTLYSNPRHIPLTDWIAPQDRYAREYTTSYGYKACSVYPPVYLEDMTLNLSSVLINGEDENATPLTFSVGHDPNVMSEELSKRTTLDIGQARAMVLAFRSHLALIQGPPGTGKSYVGIQIAKCLLANQTRLNLGPILCVCYTNHALDQFLQGLYDSGISRIVRIGSRTASPLLESLSLDNYKKLKRIPRIQGHGRRISEQQNRLGDLAVKIGDICNRLQSRSDGIIRPFLQKRFPTQEVQITEGVMVVEAEPLATWARGNGPGDLSGNGDERTIEQLLSVNKWTLTNEERKRLLEYWYRSATKELSLELQNLMQQHALEKRKLTSLFNEADARVFNQVDVVGITTTGLANNADLVRSLRAKVLICEEAGEVLESHILTAFLPPVQHAILIGDHLQLRPKISTQRLSVEYNSIGPKYNLDESLFERLANFRPPNQQISTGEGENVDDVVRFPVAQLDHQRRMHPSIASLVRGTLYPNLCDHPRTHSYDGISGFKRRLFWLDHRNTEDPDDPDDPMRSKTNTWEVEMVISVVKHLCKQEHYRSGDIAILTPYIGQLRLLRNELESIVDLVIAEQDLANLDESEAEDGANSRNNHNRRTVGKGKLSDQVRLATVDNFQGDEATVVIVSLVRSNKYRNCGFLKTSNRINVLLSRAKHGMYIIGNADTASCVPMWSSVIRMLEDGGNIGPKLQLECSRHPQSRIYVSTPEGFLEQAPEGGCAERCEQRLPCGHSCTFKCHSNTRHDAVKCMKPCTKMKKCGHSCPQKCYERCRECIEKITNVPLPCGHTTNIECREMDRIASVKCGKVVVKRLPGCGHDTRSKCHEDISKTKCFHPCQQQLDCGHICRRPCWQCWKSNGQHAQTHSAPCTAVCGRSFSTCSHICTRPCHPSTPCSPCDQPCEVRCRHNKCPKKCSDPCAPCAEKCGWSCIHRQKHPCNMPCAVPCDIIPCSKRCDKILSCGHRCPNICGEKCPDRKFCQTCGDTEVLERSVDLIMFNTYGKINVDEDPCVFLSCGHFYTVSSLDGIMDMKEYYNVDPVTDTIIGPRSAQRVVSSDSKLRGCPECRLPLRDIHRYNRIIKKALLDESTKRFIVTASSTYKGLVDAVSRREIELENARADSPYLTTTGLPGDSAVVGSTKWPGTKEKLEKKIDKFIKSMAAAEQPYGRVNALLVSAASREDTVKSDVFQVDESKIQTGFQIRGQVLQLRLAWAILWGQWSILTDPRVDPKLRSERYDEVGNQVKGFIRDCWSIRDSSKTARLLAQEVEAMVYYALFSLLSLSISRKKGQQESLDSDNELHNQASTTLQACETLYSDNLGTLGFLKDDIEKAKGLLNGATFYSFVSTEEKKQIYNAMASQFLGTGHWYYCRNGHPFTVGECGMPMEEARCLQCGERVGGLDHTPSAGVRRADDLEREFGSY